MAEKLCSGYGSILLAESKDYLVRLSREYAEEVTSALDTQLECGPEERAELIETLVRGSLALVRVKRAFRPLDRPKYTPLIDPDQGPKREDRVRPTWIAIELRGEAGELYPQARLRVRLPDGSVRAETVQEDSSWRMDDVAEHGTCHVELLERGEPSSPGSASPRALDGSLREGGPSVALVTGRTHTLVADGLAFWRPTTCALPTASGSGLTLPGPWSDGEHPWPTLLALLHESRARKDVELVASLPAA